MMQQVATSHADVAAFAANNGQKEQNHAGLADGFDQVLQQQTPREPSRAGDNKTADASRDDVAAEQEVATTDQQSAGEDPAAKSEKPLSDVDLEGVAPENTSGQLTDNELPPADTWVSLVGKLQSLTSMEQGKDKPFLATDISPELNEASLQSSETALPLMTDKAGGTNPVKLLLNLPQGKLDTSLKNLAQGVVNPTLESNSQGANQEFIAALQAGVADLKSQLAQGKEPGLDLQALVAEAMSKANMDAKQPAQLEIKLKAFSQVLGVTQQLSSAVDTSQPGNANALNTESGLIPIDQLKQAQIQSSPAGSQLEKAINIAKPEGHQQLAEKVRWMVNAKQLVADIRLDPAELGAMQVKVSISGESATVNFVVQSHHARDALENATPKLRELLGERGIELGQSSVKQDQGNTEEKNLSKGHAGMGEEEPGGTDEPENENLMQQAIVNGALGGIDYFV
ncbi:MAG: flagellar hook-length control protein FliK [Paraglaciecola sp.]|jgi:flagellar hook-length control protein FliK